MATDIVNITESKNLQDRVTFEVDAAHVTPAAVEDLAHCVHELVCEEHVQHFFDQDFVPYAAMVEVSDPLKFQVRPLAHAQLSRLTVLLAPVRGALPSCLLSARGHVCAVLTKAVAVRVAGSAARRPATTPCRMCALTLCQPSRDI